MNNNQINKLNFSYIFGFIIFLLPALVLTIPKGISILEAMSFLAVIYFGAQLWKQRYDLFWSSRWIIVAFALNLIIGFISILYSEAKISLVANASKQLITVVMIGLIVIIKPKFKWFWYGLFVGTVITAIIALYQRFGMHLGRAHGFLHPIMFGDLAIVMALMSLVGVDAFKNARERWLLYIAFAAGILASLLSGSRGSWIGFLLAFIIFCFYQRHTIEKKMIIMQMIAVMVVVGICFMPNLGIFKRITEISYDIQKYQVGNPDTPIGIRFELWKASWKMFSEHSIAGVGRGNFKSALQSLNAQGEISSEASRFRHAHNEMLHALATQGILGGFALLLLYVAPIVFFTKVLRCKDERRPYALAGLLLVYAFIGFGLTEVLFTRHIGTEFYALFICVLAGMCTRQQQETTLCKGVE